MDIPVDRDFVEQHILRLRIEEQQRELQLRLQQDYGVFISYSHADKRPARRLARFFEGRKIRHFLDEKKLRLGDHIGEKLGEHMDALTHCLLVLSPRSARSRWCSYECGIAVGQKKPVLFLMTEAGMRPPPFAQPTVATASVKEIEGFFANDLIDRPAIDRFLGEILADPVAGLESFRPAGRTESGCAAWAAPDAEKLQAQTRSERAYLDDYVDTSVWRLVRVEIGFPREPECIALHYSRVGAQTKVYTLSYREELTAVVANSKMTNSDRVGVVEPLESGRTRVVKRTLNPIEELEGRASAVYGWSASPDFWDLAFERLRSRLPRQRP